MGHCRSGDHCRSVGPAVGAIAQWHLPETALGGAIYMSPAALGSSCLPRWPSSCLAGARGDASGRLPPGRAGLAFSFSRGRAWLVRSALSSWSSPRFLDRRRNLLRDRDCPWRGLACSATPRKKDPVRYGHLPMMGVIGLIVAMIVKHPPFFSLFPAKPAMMVRHLGHWCAGFRRSDRVPQRR